LLVVGDGPLKEDILKQIRNLKLTNRVFMFGQKDQKEIPKYLLLSDVFCRPSRTEGQGIAFLEAMALGVPVLATRVGGIVDFLKDGETGLFFEKDNSEDLALKLNLISEDKILKNKLVDKAKKLVSEHYDWDDLVLKMKSDFFNSFF
jgi:glycosyltransferase involved in cell wall biosynthesis